MEHWKKKNSFSYKDLLYKALIFVGTVAFIVYFLPRDGKFNYQFDINKPWKYGQLMATFDFPIYKDEAVVKREQDSLLASFQPYFELDKEVEKSALAKLKENYHAHLKGILPSTDYIRYIERGLKAIYQSGVVSTEEMRTLLHDSISSVMVIEDKLANQRTTDGIYTVKRAYENLISGDTAHYNRDILRQCALNEYITPNLIYDSVRTETARKELLDNYSWANGVVQSGQKIIDRGEIVNKQTYNILESLRKESIKRSESIGQKRLILGGQILFVGILILCFMLYLELFRKDYYERKGSLSLLFALIVFYCVITALMVTNNIFNVYILPYAMLPIIIRVFLDSRTAFLTHVITILIDVVFVQDKSACLGQSIFNSTKSMSQSHDDGVIIGSGNRIDELHILVVTTGMLFVQQAVKGGNNIGGGHLFARGCKFDTLAQVEGPGHIVIAVLPALSQAALELAGIGIDLQQALV